MDKTKEIRAILSGRTYLQNGAYIAADRLLKMNFQGVDIGGAAASFFGVSHLIRHYEAKDPVAAEQAIEVFGSLGRPVLFTASPQENACLVRPIFGNPSILVLEKTENGLLLNVYTARTLLSILSRSRAVSLFERRLPQELRESFAATNENVKRERPSRKIRRAARKAAKWEKKARKQVEKYESVAGEAQQKSAEQEKQM